MGFKEEILKRRTFGIISHPDAGKTTLTEKLLLFGGAIHVAGAVKSNKIKKTATSDFMEIERQRGISVATSVMGFEYKDVKINILDTPGHQDFAEDTFRVLTACDSVIIVVDSAKGVETQTRKLMQVCRMRKTPVIVFINKLDRPGQDPFDLLDEIEKELQIQVTPLSWPIGNGDQFKGIYNIHRENLCLYSASVQTIQDGIEINDINSGELDEHIGERSADKLREDLELVREVYPAIDRAAYLDGQVAPVFFGSALNNFGIREMLDCFIEIAPSPLPRETDERLVQPDEEKFTGFVFKIQANMDPHHRDRIAFLRVCSGRYEPGMKVFHVREGKEMKIPNALTFMAQERKRMEEAVAGDIIGIYNHGQLHIGDTLTEGEKLGFVGIPFFAPELFRSVRCKNPFKEKQLRQGLQELGEEGAIQVFTDDLGHIYLGAVGILQFEIVAQRLATEYRVDAIYESTEVSTARWLVFPDDKGKTREEFEAEQASRLATDADGNLVYLATSVYNLQTTQKHWENVQFLTTREMGQKFN